MANKDYSNARARKKSSSGSLGYEDSISKSDAKKVYKKVKKSPILIIGILFLIIGGVIGYFAFSYLSVFEMNFYTVNGVASQETDYVVIDMSKIRDELLIENPEIRIDQVFQSVELNDKGVTCKLFGFDISKSVSLKYYYREDISHDTESVEEIDLSVAGVYYIEYTSSNFFFKNVKLIRTIVVTGVEDNG